MMEKRSLGTVVIAGVIALALVVTAYTATRAHAQHMAPAALAVATDAAQPTEDLNHNGVPDWQEALNATVVQASSTDSYRAPSSLPPTEALAREIFADYAAARQGGTLDMNKAKAAIADTLAHSANTASPPKTYDLSDLSVHADVPVKNYGGALNVALNDATKVHEYELTTFARAMNGSKADFVRLQAAADVYAQIAQKLAGMQVPDALAEDHLAALNSLSALSSATRDLSHWSGDPLIALALVNNFTQADGAFSSDLTILYTRIGSLEKKS